MVERITIIAIVLVVGGGSITGLIVGINYIDYENKYQIPIIERTPNVFKETNIPCFEGTGHQVSGTDKYGFGWAGCFQDGCEYDESIVGDHMRCVTVTLVE